MTPALDLVGGDADLTVRLSNLQGGVAFTGLWIFEEPLMHLAPVARLGHQILSLRLG